MKGLATNTRSKKPTRLRWQSSVELKATVSNERAKFGAIEFKAAGITAQRVDLNSDRDISFSWRGRAHYVAIHQICHVRSETFSDDNPVDRSSDLQRRLTFIPAGCTVWGWGLPKRSDQSFTALYLNLEQIEEELAERTTRLPDRSSLYFTDVAMGSTFQKIHSALSVLPSVDAIYLESLCLTGALELCQRQARHAGWIKPAGHLARAVERRVTDYIDAHISRDITLDDLARLSGLSRFHFSRAFKRTTQCGPYQYLLRRRIEQAGNLLKKRQKSIAEIATGVGFKSTTQFIRAFRRIEGITPGQFREILRSEASD